MNDDRLDSFTQPSRRRLLGLIGATTILPLAGCLGDDDNGMPTPTPNDGPPFSETRFVDQYTMTADFEEYHYDFRFHGEDFYMIETFMDNGGKPIEYYYVDGVYYVIRGEDCHITSYIDFWSADDFDDPRFHELMPVRTGEIDGETVYVYVTVLGDQYDDVEVTLYVLADSQYLRRVEAFSKSYHELLVVIDFGSWEEVDEIQVPALDCGVPPSDEPPTDDVPGEDLDDVPRYPDSVRTNWAYEYDIEYTTDASIEAVLDFYETQLPDHGWTVTNSFLVGNFGEIEAEKDGTFLVITVMPGSYAGYNAIWIQYYP